MNDRRDDWIHGVDENLASLNTGQRVADRQLDDLELKYEAIDHLLRGDPEIERDGLIGRLHALETTLNKFGAVLENVRQAIEGDHTGHPGLRKMLTDLSEARADKRETRSNRWKAFTAIAVALIGGGYLWAVWPHISAFIHRRNDPLEDAIDQAKRPRGRKRVIYRTVPASTEDSD